MTPDTAGADRRPGSWSAGVAALAALLVIAIASELGMAPTAPASAVPRRRVRMAGVPVLLVF